MADRWVDVDIVLRNVMNVAFEKGQQLKDSHGKPVVDSQGNPVFERLEKFSRKWIGLKKMVVYDKVQFPPVQASHVEEFEPSPQMIAACENEIKCCQDKCKAE